VSNGSGASRGDRNRNARLARLRELVPVTNATVSIDLADTKQMVVVTDHDSKVVARRTFRCRAWDLGSALDWAAGPTQKLAASSLWLLAPYIAIEAALALALGERAASALGSPATAGETASSVLMQTATRSTAAASPVAVACCVSAPSRGSSSTSGRRAHVCTANPAPAIASAIGSPWSPKPMNPTTGR